MDLLKRNFYGVVLTEEAKLFFGGKVENILIKRADELQKVVCDIKQ